MNPANGEYNVKEESMQVYSSLVKKELKRLMEYKLELIPRNENSHANPLASLGLASELIERRSIILATLDKPSFIAIAMRNVHEYENWMNPIESYLISREFPV